MPCCCEKVAHRRIDVLVGAPHVVSLVLQERRERRHGRAADADEMNALSCRLDDMPPYDRRFLDHDSGRRAGDDAARTPNGSVTSARTCGPTGDRRGPALENRRARRRRRRALPDCRPARRISATRRTRRPTRAPRRPLNRSCVSIRSSRYGRSPTSSRKSTQPAGGSKAYGVPSDAVSCVRVPPTSMPAASPAA